MLYSLRGLLVRRRAARQAADPVPLVSCIMPTSNRREFFDRAVHFFRRQDYPNKELVVVDDGQDLVQDLVAGKPDIRYMGLASRTSIGEKRNIAVAASRGEIVVHWDDDDWYDPARLSYQVAPLIADQADLTALKMTYLYDLRTDSIWYVDQSLHQVMFFLGVHTGSIAYRRRFWREAGPFPEEDLAEDVAFLRRLVAQEARLLRLPNDTVFAGLSQLASESDLAVLEEVARRCGGALYPPRRAVCVYVRHGANAWQFACGRHLDRARWHRLAPEALLPGDDLRHYRAIATQQPSPWSPATAPPADREADGSPATGQR
jgi:glycosyltransferase involved in cell wall biosynthesis